MANGIDSTDPGKNIFCLSGYSPKWLFERDAVSSFNFPDCKNNTCPSAWRELKAKTFREADLSPYIQSG